MVKADGIISGTEVVKKIFSKIDPTITCSFSVTDGTFVKKGTVIGTAFGSARSLLLSERLVLNVAQRMSGVASATHRMAESLKRSGSTRILDTRKTAPGLRALDKLAVVHGGGGNHRVGLYDMVLIKDNHITASGGVKPAILNTQRMFALRGARSSAWQSEELKAQLAAGGVWVGEEVFRASEHAADDPIRGETIVVEIEVGSIAELKDVLSLGGVDRIMLDNMVKVRREKLSEEELSQLSKREEDWERVGAEWVSVSQGMRVCVDVTMVEQCMELVNKVRAESGWALEMEVSGNVVEDTVGAIGKTGVNYVSSGALTHSVIALDISMKIKL